VALRQISKGQELRCVKPGAISLKHTNKPREGQQWGRDSRWSKQC
jgi:hypothetical protein